MLEAADAYDWTNDAKVRNSRQGFTDQERQHIQKFLRNGWTDLVGSHDNSHGSNYTWFMTKSERKAKLGRRIDLCLWKGIHHLKVTTRQDIPGSDHVPLLVGLIIKQESKLPEKFLLNTIDIQPI